MYFWELLGNSSLKAFHLVGMNVLGACSELCLCPAVKEAYAELQAREAVEGLMWYLKLAQRDNDGPNRS